MKNKRKKLMLSNTKVLKELNFKPKKTKKKKINNHNPRKEKVEIWSVEQHAFIVVRSVPIKKVKKLSPYWAKILAEWEAKQ